MIGRRILVLVRFWMILDGKW